MWTLERPTDGDLGGQAISPTETLYEYDGPMIFRTKLGLVDLLCNKVSVREGRHLYLACSTNDRTVDALKNGRLSVFGAFDAAAYWILSLDESLAVLGYWNCEREEVPTRFFAKPGLGLYHWQGKVPDSLEQASAMLAIKFKGPQLTHEGMPFGKFKDLMDQSFDAVRKLLTPVALLNRRTSTFDFEIAPPKFASLVIAVKEPVFNMALIRRTKELKKYTRDELEKAVEHLGQEFAERIIELRSLADEDKIDGKYAEENFSFLDILSEILPQLDGDIDSVEFTAFGKDGVETALFDQKVSSEIKQKLAIAQANTVVEHGVIVGITSRSTTLLVQSIRGKIVTCKFEREYFNDLLQRDEFKIPRPVRLRGAMFKRPRRDYMDVESVEFINPERVRD
ncbi:hypothetical protein E0H56_04415 [Rhizobium leguminosarum bv. viciae]|uniref:hypothetical protein n=1 Tax=Rhizobium leguminosarum TaxID=384 RepID=UPI00104081AD|nr:hypothetical protein [Rhizobium leguminosarum]TBZ96341.1 hypothetical protein E0H56_04415 [Rhizobium leguminosarum bv. viciae]